MSHILPLPSSLLHVQVQLTYSTTGGQKYSFSVSFPPRYSLDGDDCRVDISDENIVLVLAKNEESSDKEWDDFNVGLKSAQSKVRSV